MTGVYSPAVRFVGVLVFALAISSALQAQEVEVTVENPSPVARAQEPVVIPWAAIVGEMPGLVRPSLRLVDEQHVAHPLQVDDLDFDGKPDEVVFLADFAPHQKRLFTLTHSTGAQTSEPKTRTDAANWKRVNGVLQSLGDDDVPGDMRIRGNYRFDGVGWESDVTAYRVYLDERNAVDILGKRKAGLYWNYIGSSDVDYQQDADWGMDVLHVGSALGIGGIGFWVGDSVKKPVAVDRQRTRIVARGPVRAVVSVVYTGWRFGGLKADVTSLFIIYAGHRECEHRVILGDATGQAVLAAGIVRHDSTEFVWNPAGGWLYSDGHQSRAGDSLMLALNVYPLQKVRELEGPYDHLLLIPAITNVPVRMLISYYWQGEGGRMWNRPSIEQFLQSIARQITEPLTVKLTSR